MGPTTTMYGGKTLHRSGLSVIEALMDNENYNIITKLMEQTGYKPISKVSWFLKTLQP